MSTMNISLTDSLKSFVEEQVTQRGYSTRSEYVRELVRNDADVFSLRGKLLSGAASDPAAPVDAGYFSTLRKREKKRARK